MTDLAEKTRWVADRLEREMGVPERPGPPGDLLAQLVRTILSQNTADVNSGRAFQHLVERFSDADGTVDWAAVASANRPTLERTIRVAGLAGQKAEWIHGLLAWAWERNGAHTLADVCEIDPDGAVERLTEVRGVGVKTAAVLLCFSCGADIFPVDTHVNRVCRRLGLVPPRASAEKTFREMRDKVPKGRADSLHRNMVRFGRTRCRARNPRCADCPLRSRCRYFRETREAPEK
jgi:endonuclease-3